MHLVTIGLNHVTAPLKLRENLSFSSAIFCAILNNQFNPASPHFPGNTIFASIIVSTSNRLEYYALIKDPHAATTTILNIIAHAGTTARQKLFALEVDHL